jgi:hemoglobin
MQERDLHAVRERFGDDRIRAVVDRFYEAVPADPILGPMYPQEDLAGAATRLADFLVYRLGGPTTYLETRGHPRLRMRHARFRMDPETRDVWLRHMTAAIERELEDCPERATLHAFLEHVAHFLVGTTPEGPEASGTGSG